MTSQRNRLAVAGAAISVCAVLAVACTNTYLYDERRETNRPSDRTVSIQGEFCTPATAQVVRPVKVFIAMDASQSMKVTDPDGSRANATVALLDSLPNEKEVEFVVMLFAGSTTAYLTKDNLQHFERVVDYSPNDKLLLRQRILNFAVSGNTANRDSTDFVKPLSSIYSLINNDISNGRLSPTNEDVRARYSVIFLSDGHPTNNQDDELLCGDAVRRIRQLKILADDVTVNMVHVFLPRQPLATTTCDLDGGTAVAGGSACRLPILPPSACPLLLINTDAERLNKMAMIGGGDFRDFRNNEPINFLSFKFGNVRRTFGFDKLIASNLSAIADSPEDQADTDSDGLLDADELRLGTSPFMSDTDGDGFSDGIEVFYGARGAMFTPNQVALPDGGGLDLGCAPDQRGLDSDCDGLTDCDEQIVGSNAFRADSDDDGITDFTEWKLGTQPASKDLEQDPDNDQLLNGEELAMHTNPVVADSSKLSTVGYRYQVVKQGGLTEQGQQCFSFHIDNVSLVNTLPDTRDAGNPDGGPDFIRRGAGYNDLLISLSSLPGDDPTAHTLVQTFRHTTSRYPVGGIRSPVDGIIRVGPTDFVSGCGQAQVVQSP
jgi:hypothetical protein